MSDAAAAVAHAQRLGAQPTGSSELGTDGNGYAVLRDPEGNEFCFFVDTAGSVDQPARRWPARTLTMWPPGR